MNTKPYIIFIDNESNLKEQLLPEYGAEYNLEAFDEADDALSFLMHLKNQGSPVSLIIVDYTMPEIKGDAYLLKLRNYCERHTPILLTGQADLRDIKNALNNAGIFKFIPKPWASDSFYKAVQDALQYFCSNSKNKNGIGFPKKTHVSGRNSISASEPVHKLSEEVRESLISIRDGIDMVQRLKKNTDNEELKSCIKSIDTHFLNIADSMNQLLNNLESNNLGAATGSDENNGHFVMPNQSNPIETKFHEYLNDLADRINNIERLLKNKMKKVVAWNDEKILLFNPDEILFFVSENRNNFAATRNGKYKVRKSIYQLEEDLKEDNFFRCHRSYLINLNYVKKIEPGIGYNSYISTIEGCNEEIPVSKNYIKDMKSIFGL